MGFWNDVRSTVSSIAPTLGAALGGPLGGLAGQAIASVLGVDPADDAAIKSAIKGMTGEQAVELKKADIAFQQRMKELEVDVLRLNVDDRNSARQREMAVKDYTPMVLAGIVITGFFCSIGYVLSGKVGLTGEQGILVGTIVGYVANAATQVLSYYFGSSASSKEKNQLIASTIKNGAV